MSIHRFMTQVSDLNYNFKNVLQIQTCDYNEYSNNGLTISGSSPSKTSHLVYASDLGNAMRDNDGENYSWMNGFSTMIYDDREGTGSNSGNLSKFCTLLTSLKIERGESRIIWFGSIDSTLTKHVPRIEIREQTGTYTSYYLKYLIDNVEYYSVNLTAEFGAKYLPWRGDEKLISLGDFRYFWSESEPDPVTHVITITTQLSIWNGRRTDITALGNQWFDIVEEKDLYDDMFGGGGYSEESDKDDGGNFSDDSDDPVTDDLPDIDAVGSGFATIFTPTKGQLKELSELFWNKNFAAFLTNLVENISDMFVSLAMVPFEVPAGSTVTVTWLGWDTGVPLRLASKQYLEFDMGSIDLANDSRIFTSKSVLDYSPFSHLGIYLPFIGYQELDIDECRDAVINLRYRIDILSGACVAIIRISGKDLYEFSGNCLTQIPLTNSNMQALVSDAVNVGISVAGIASAKGTMSAVADQTNASTMSAEKKEVAMAHARESVGHADTHLASATANLMTSGKPVYRKSGSLSSSVSMLAVKQPYLFLTTPRQSLPRNYNRYCGYPSNITGKLSEFSGYTVVENIRLNDLVATSPEVAEIYTLLKQGVII